MCTILVYQYCDRQVQEIPFWFKQKSYDVISIYLSLLRENLLLRLNIRNCPNYEKTRLFLALFSTILLSLLYLFTIKLKTADTQSNLIHLNVYKIYKQKQNLPFLYVLNVNALVFVAILFTSLRRPIYDSIKIIIDS